MICEKHLSILKEKKTLFPINFVKRKRQIQSSEIRDYCKIHIYLIIRAINMSFFYLLNRTTILVYSYYALQLISPHIQIETMFKEFSNKLVRWVKN